MIIKIIIIVSILVVYLSRFRPSVIRRIVKNKEINKSLLAWEALFLGFIIMQLMGFTFGKITKNFWLPYIGIGLLIFGLLLSVYARIKLGNNYMPAISTKASMGLITNGVYKIVRHPIYLGGLLGILGIELAFNSPMVLVVTIICLIVMKKQIDKEERILHLQHGTEWTNYKKQTRFKLIPFIY